MKTFIFQHKTLGRTETIQATKESEARKILSNIVFEVSDWELISSTS